MGSEDNEANGRGDDEEDEDEEQEEETEDESEEKVNEPRLRKLEVSRGRKSEEPKKPLCFTASRARDDS